MLFTENFLHYIWKFKLFNHDSLQTTSGEELQILSAGLHNHDSGPDFHNARIRIGETTWAGNVEIHVSSSDWRKHKHQDDAAYHNVILHVVYHDDEPLHQPSGQKVATLILKNRISGDLYARYHQLVYGNQQVIPCEGSIKNIKSITLHNWLTRVLVERLQKKSLAIIQALQYNRGNWEETFYQQLAISFGFKVNALPFELLAKALPQNLLGKHKNSSLQIEALIFGQAGFLADEFTDTYPNILKAEYLFLQKKYGLVPIEKHLWKFMRLRPQNFPTIRLAQFAALIMQSNHLLSKVLETDDVTALRKLFTVTHVNEYWENHYRFDKEAKPSPKNMGQASVNLLLLNTLAVFLFSYGHHQQLQPYVNRSLQLLENLPVEQNHIINDFEDLGIKINSAFESQALLELRNSYCNFKKCLQCGVGNQILNIT
ncbi:DUF2851 family protein [Mucilaginibacter robiniae]|uniref:DUF2851 family protein n=1 Tax=Mucilaginibacter robiniae TaxID=2728022 RepID=A0A7L5DTT3_9SPHI|nr:DUF2851 family protein [Mucilaginibacter robiniae]QJD94510.1 DUF2851 family protein [Mucilaginibacter robiniae]